MNIAITCLPQQVPGITDLGLMPRKIAKVAVLGGGLMGSGIVTALILTNYPVILKEVNEKFLNAGIDRVKGMHVIDLFIIFCSAKYVPPIAFYFKIPFAYFTKFIFQPICRAVLGKGK